MASRRGVQTWQPGGGGVIVCLCACVCAREREPLSVRVCMYVSTQIGLLLAELVNQEKGWSGPWTSGHAGV